MAIEDQVRARLRQARFERGVPLVELAQRAGMAASTLSRLETGARRLTLAHVERLADALELSPDALLAARPIPAPARDGRTWSPVGAERPGGPQVYRVVLPVEDPVRHQHEGHQWLHVLDGTRAAARRAHRPPAPSRGDRRVLDLGTARRGRGRASRRGRDRLLPLESRVERRDDRLRPLRPGSSPLEVVREVAAE